MLMDKSTEKVREYWNAQPCNFKRSLESIGSKKYFEQITRNKRFVEPHTIPFLEPDKWKNKKVLEIGCGLGVDSTALAKAGANLTVVELSEKSLDLCKMHLGHLGLDAKYYVGDAEHLEDFLPKQKFDFVYSFGVLHHIPNPSKAISSIVKYMKPGAELRIMLYAFWSLKNLMIHLDKTQCEAQEGVPVANTYSALDVFDLLAPNDLEVLSIKKRFHFRWDINIYKKYRYRLNKFWRLIPEWLYNLVEPIIGWNLLIKAQYEPGYYDCWCLRQAYY